MAVRAECTPAWRVAEYRRATGKKRSAGKSIQLLEAAIGIEPMNKGFADLCLTTWLRRRTGEHKG